MKVLRLIVLSIFILSIYIGGDFYFKVYMTSLPNELDIISKVTLFPESINYDSNIPYENGNAILSLIDSRDKKTLRVINSTQNDYFELLLPKYSGILLSSEGSQNKYPQIIMWDDLFELTYAGTLLVDNPIYELNVFQIIDKKEVLQEKIQGGNYRRPEQMNDKLLIVTALDSDKSNLQKHISIVEFQNTNNVDLEQLGVNFKQYHSDTPIVLANNFLLYKTSDDISNETISVYSLKTQIVNTYNLNKHICIDSIVSGKYDIDGNIFAWINCDDSETINVFDTSTGSLSQIATNVSKKTHININNNYLLWVETIPGNSEKSNICGMDLKSGKEFIVAKDMFDVSKPIFFNDYIYWSNIIPTMIADQRYVFRKKIPK